jgi:hypothetical protein
MDERKARLAAITALSLGAIGSLLLMARMGQRQQSVLVIVLFVIWDAAPFALLGLAVRASRGSNARLRAAVYAVSIAVSIASTGAYLVDTIGPSHPQAAFMYVIVPPIAVVVAGIVLLTAHRLYNVK